MNLNAKKIRMILNWANVKEFELGWSEDEEALVEFFQSELKKVEKVFFHFHDQNTETSYRIPVSCDPKEWDDWVMKDIDSEDSFVAGLEEIAVHDAHDLEDDDNNFYVGFTSYEAEDQETINKILKSWKEKLAELGWTKENDEFTAIQMSEDDE